MSIKNHLIGVLLLFSIGVGNASSEVVSDIQVSGLNVKIVRIKEKDCLNGYNYFFKLEGIIGPDAREIISRTIDTIDPCLYKPSNKRVKTQVYLKSEGGFLLDGVRLGEFFRENNIQTEISDGAVCASACAIAFLGGTTRVMNGKSILLFHSPYRKTGIGIDCSDKKDRSVFKESLVKFMGEIDGGYLFERAMSYCSNEYGWAINKGAAKVFNITNYDR
jgi:hypothetical protein